MSDKEKFQEVWDELLAVASDNVMREWPELKEFCFHIYRCGSADGALSERTRIKKATNVLKRKYEKHMWGGTALEIANEMLAVIDPKAA